MSLLTKCITKQNWISVIYASLELVHLLMYPWKCKPSSESNPGNAFSWDIRLGRRDTVFAILRPVPSSPPWRLSLTKTPLMHHFMTHPPSRFLSTSVNPSLRSGAWDNNLHLSLVRHVRALVPCISQPLGKHR